MDLLVDLGNSRLKWAIRRGAEWRHGSVAAGRALDEALDEAWGGMDAPQRVLVASVAAADRRAALAAWMAGRWSLHPEFVTARVEQCGVRNLYRDPTQLGADRWAALIGTRSLTDAAACVVDCGTAVTVDALSADGQFLGGVILPGIRLQRQALFQGTAGIRALDGDDTSCFARSTADAVAAGSVFGLAGAIERICREFEEASGESLLLYLTGGDSDLLAGRLGRRFIPVPDLVLRGLAAMADAS